MHIRVTTDPISLKEIHDLKTHPCHYEGDGENGLEIYFETEDNMKQFLEWEYSQDGRIALTGNSSDDYVAEG